MPPVKDSRTYGGRSGDERAAERRFALLDAAFTRVAADGWRAVSIESVCRQAGLNKRYFYESFSDLDALNAALTTHLADAAIAATLAASTSQRTTEDSVRSGISAFVVHLTDDPRRARVLFGAVPAADAAAGHRAEAVRQLIATVTAQASNLLAVTPDPFVEVTAAMLVGGTSQAVLDWLDGRIATSREALVDDLVALWLFISDGAAARLGG